MLTKNLKVLSIVALVTIAGFFPACKYNREEIKKNKVTLKSMIKQVDGSAQGLGDNVLGKVKFEKITLDNTKDKHTSLTVGPDRKLYASTIDGRLKRFKINADGTLAAPEILYTLQDANGKRTSRLIVGFTLDPKASADNLVAWITHSSFTLNTGPDWDGKLTRLSGPNLEVVQDVLINLPRSAKDHLTNNIAFGPDSALYFSQGSNTAMGAPDNTWANREDHLLSGAILRLDLAKLKETNLPLDVKTSEGGTYKPYALNAPLTIFATGIRNAYDLLWHSNGQLYVPNNGSDVGGITPASVPGALRPDGSLYKGPQIPALTNVQQVQPDLLFRVEKGGYYGHPNPSRGEFVMNGGNPTTGPDPIQVDQYPVGTLPDANWRGVSFAFSVHNSPNGIIEYKGNAFSGQLDGRILVVRLVNDMDIMVLEPGGSKQDIIKATEGTAIPGFWNFFMPLDLTEDIATSNIYVSEYGGEGQIILLRPLSATMPLLSVSR